MAKRKSYDLNFKLKVIVQAECEGYRIVARQLHIDKKQIRQWRKQKCCIQEEITMVVVGRNGKGYVEEVKRLRITMYRK